MPHIIPWIIAALVLVIAGFGLKKWDDRIQARKLFARLAAFDEAARQK